MSLQLQAHIIEVDAPPHLRYVVIETAPEVLVLGVEVFYEDPIDVDLSVMGVEVVVDPYPYNASGQPYDAAPTKGRSRSATNWSAE